MIRRSRPTRFDVATAIHQGRREYQEDAIAVDFPVGTDMGYVVLADGMGGHAAGDVASKLVLTEAFSQMKFQIADMDTFRANVPAILNNIALSANQCLRDYVSETPDVRGMGATLIVPTILEDQLYWISIGDSPLYLIRKGKIQQLNEDHSLAPQIDVMLEQGLIDEETARDHPDRNCLTSVLLGDKVARIDCRPEPFQLEAGDIVIAASDGLQFMPDPKIELLVHKNRRRNVNEIADILLTAVMALNDPDQDNISFSVIKINHTRPGVALRSTAAPDDISTEDVQAILREAEIDPLEHHGGGDRTTKLIPFEIPEKPRANPDEHADPQQAIGNG